MADQRPILLVEDNPDDVELTLHAFQTAAIGNRIIVATDGADAIDRLTAAHDGSPADLPALILLDLNLPKIRGMEVLKHIRARDRTSLLPVIVLTTSTEEQDLEDCYRLGANSYVQKPVSFDQFQQVVGQLSRYWLLLNEAPPTPH